MPFTVVSMPALSSERTSSIASASVISPASARSWMQRPKPPGASPSRPHCAVTEAACGVAAATARRRRSLSGRYASNTADA